MKRMNALAPRNDPDDAVPQFGFRLAVGYRGVLHCKT